MPRINGSFNGIIRLFEVTSGVTSVDVLDLYSDWKEWSQLAENLKYPRAFISSGGEPSAAGIRGQYIDITNGWQIKINNSVEFIGNVFRDVADPEGSDRSVILEENGVVLATVLASPLAAGVEINTGSGLSTAQAQQLTNIENTTNLLPDSIWSYLLASISTANSIGLAMKRLWQRNNLDRDNPVNRTESGNDVTETFDNVTITHSSNGSDSVTSTRA